MAHPWMPRPESFVLTKSDLLTQLRVVDADDDARNRVLSMEINFRRRIDTHLTSLPLVDAQFSKFKTNPFVLFIHSMNKRYHYITEIERDILPAKIFSSMETSAGKMVELVVLPTYGWEAVPSQMHSSESVIDGRRTDGDTIHLLTLKSGPNTLNDPSGKNIADDIVRYCTTWAAQAGVSNVEFSYGALYGTKRQSNKKDWRILANIADEIGHESMELPPVKRWHCAFIRDGVKIQVTVRLGVELWNHLYVGRNVFMEIIVALIRACIAPTDVDPRDRIFTIADLESIVSLDPVPTDFNVSLLQRSQLEWLFLAARHFCDDLMNS